MLDPRLYLVIGPDDCAGRPFEWVVEEALAGGVTLVQLRDKTRAGAALAKTAARIQPILKAHGVPLIVNDDLEATLRSDAEGLHVGQDDLSAAEARERLPANRCLGLSVTALAEARAPRPAGIDYLGLGPVFATPTKADAAPACGLDGLAAICRAVPGVATVAIGGIKTENAEAVMQAGVDGIAVVSAIAAAEDPRAAAGELRRIVDRVLAKR